MKVLVDRTAVALAIPKKEWIELPEQASLAQLIDILAERYDPSLYQELLDGGELSEDMLVMINGCNASQLDGVRTVLEDNDNVYFMVMACDG